MDVQFDLEATKKTFPWTEQIMHGPMGAIVRMVDCNNQEVPLFTMTRFLMTITSHLSRKPEAPSQETA